MSPNTPADALLYWASERGAGKWSAYRDAAASVGRGIGARGGYVRRPWEFAARASALAHVDIDWDGGEWSAARPCLALSEGMALCAYLAGWRTRCFMDRFERATDRLDVYPFNVQNDCAPTSVFAKFQSVSAMQEVAEELSIPIVWNPAEQLVDLVGLGESATMQRASAPPFDEELDFFEARSLEWIGEASRELEGLYRFDLHGRTEFRLRDAEGWRHIDRSVGQMHVLQGRSDVLTWHKPTSDFSQPPVLTLRKGLSLPSVAERACVASSGLLPQLRKDKIVYVNVQRRMAEALADSLGLVLTTANEPFITYPDAN